MRDIRNIKKAFDILDTENKGLIKYDKTKFEDSYISSKLASKYEIENEFIILNLDSYLKIMIEKIIHHRKQYNDKILFESGIKYLSY